MGLVKRNPLVTFCFLKKWLIRIFGAITQMIPWFNELQIEGSEI
jgi:hypothetical protein